MFIHRQKKNVTHTKLQKQAVRVWVPLQITELKTRTVFMYLFLSNGGERMEPVTVSLPLSDDMSCDVMDYTCEALFQGYIFFQKCTDLRILGFLYKI